MMKLPAARNKDIIIQEIGRETLVYDLVRDKAFNLNETLSAVYNACDGKMSVKDFKAKYNLNDDVIFLALDELNKENLLDDSASYISPFTGIDRREVIRRIGLASMIAIPLISGLTAPQAIAAASNCIADRNSFPIPNDGGGTSSCFTRTNDARCCSGRVTGAQVDPTTNTIIICTCGTIN